MSSTSSSYKLPEATKESTKRTSNGKKEHRRSRLFSGFGSKDKKHLVEGSANASTNSLPHNVQGEDQKYSPLAKRKSTSVTDLIQAQEGVSSRATFSE
eukprot:Awhi_evm1s6840